MPTLQARLLRIPRREITFARRGFEPCDPPVRERIEAYFESFLDGYHIALASSSLPEIAISLDEQIEPELRGFAYEGAGMYLALLDCLTPWRRDRLRRFANGPARSYAIITLIGAGLAYARVPWIRWSGGLTGRHLDPEIGWMAVDGFGFHEGFFHHARTIEAGCRPASVAGYAGRCFDHGLGRSIWFVKGAEPDRIARAVSRFEPSRQPDLWAGVGLASAYAGGVYTDPGVYAAVLDGLAVRAAQFSAELRLGIVLAAVARAESSIPSPWAALACERLLGQTLESAASLGLQAAQQVRSRMADDPRAPGYAITRELIVRRLSAAT
jgi:enediyne biosynthesis protein E3